jgi:pilus assembly protein Flp/PilA
MPTDQLGLLRRQSRQQGSHLLFTGFPFQLPSERAAASESQRGQGMVEYALIIALIAIGVVVAMTAFGTQLQTVFNTVVDNLSALS